LYTEWLFSMTIGTMHIGIDDTDSTRKGCTTYVAALLVEQLQKLGADFIDYPNLIRLNPNVPWKTRGNGALCLRIRHKTSFVDRIKETVISTMQENADLESVGTDPGAVFLERQRIPMEILAFAKNATTRIVSLKDALRLLTRFKGEAVGFNTGRGIIGALAAIGETLRADHTYEVLAYRVPENCGSKRKVDESSVFEMNVTTAPFTYNNVDPERRRVIITPRGPDPILFGIRGESPEAVKKAFQILRPLEPVERWVIFRSNQGTDAHLEKVDSIAKIKPYRSVIIRGVVATNPVLIPGRHVIFSVKDQSAHVDCAAYEPTGALRDVARKLIVGDRIEVSGAVRPSSKNHPLTINLEKIRLLKPAQKIAFHNPPCPKCHKRMESMGKNQGFRCKKCGTRDANLHKVQVRIDRDIRKGLYITSTRSQRHLTKPSGRYGMEKSHESPKGLIEGWHSP
jgi:tRNA(Ile2)-agmatinylcytidine synthase